MKKVSELLKIAFLAVFTLAVATTLSSCSDDDDDNNNGGGGGNGNIKTCYFEADGQRWDFDYAFVQYDDYEVSIIFSDIDLMHYFTNPDDIERGTYFNWVNLYFEECSDIPTGTVQSSGNDVTGEPAFNIDMETHVDLYAAMNGTYDDEDDASLWYTHDWSGDRPSQMQITKLGDNHATDICPLSFGNFCGLSFFKSIILTSGKTASAKREVNLTLSYFPDSTLQIVSKSGVAVDKISGICSILARTTAISRP